MSKNGPKISKLVHTFSKYLFKQCLKISNYLMIYYDLGVNYGIMRNFIIITRFTPFYQQKLQEIGYECKDRSNIEKINDGLIGIKKNKHASC